MSPIPSNRYDEAIFAVGIIKKVTGEKRQGGGVVPTPPGRPRASVSAQDLLGPVSSMSTIFRMFSCCNYYTCNEFGK